MKGQVIYVDFKTREKLPVLNLNSYVSPRSAVPDSNKYRKTAKNVTDLFIAWEHNTRNDSRPI